jgi:membrane peptidoglycan carboxypeptidase
METGTGQRARDAVRVFDVPIPSFGKTGTANRFTNSSFVGLIPGSDEKSSQLDVQEGYVIASYVGYDDNRPMKGTHVAIYGASGAMPLWIDTANAIVNSLKYKHNLQPADLVFNSLSDSLTKLEGFKEVPVSPITGLPIRSSLGNAGALSAPRILTEAEDNGNTLRLIRRLKPVDGEKE